MTPSTTNTAAREVVALIVRDVCETDPADPSLPESVCIRVDDLQRIAEEHIATLTHQQGGEQEALPEPFCYLDKDGYRIGSERNSTYFRSLLESSRSGKPRWRDGLTLLYTADALRAYGDARATVALRSKQPAASEGDDGDGVANCAECGAFLESVRPGKHQHPTCSQANTSKQAAGEAVAWGQFEDGRLVGLAFQRNEAGECTTPLYTTPPRHPADDGATFSVTITDGGWKGSLEEWQARRKPTIGEQLDAALAGREAGEAGLG